MAEQRAVYKAVADFSQLIRQARLAREAMRKLRRESDLASGSYVKDQREMEKTTDATTDAQVDQEAQLTKVIAAIKKDTAATSDNVDVSKDSLSVSKMLSSSLDDQGDALDKADTSLLAFNRTHRSYQSQASQSARATDAVGQALAGAADDGADLLDVLRTLAKQRGGGLLGGGGGGKGLTTDVGSFFRQIQTIAGGFIGALTLVLPTIQLIITGLISIISLLTVAAVGAAAFAAAFISVGAAMAFAAFKFRDLISGSTDGVSEWKASILAVEAVAFNAFVRLTDSFETAGKAGTSMWDSIAIAGIKLIRAMQPYIQKLVDTIVNFAAAASGTVGAYSPFLDFLRTWGEEWKKLGQIVGQDILPGGPGFFEKYEKPAKAFAEGIALVINGVRKLGRLGLGLNMDQLAEFITNVFDALAQLVQIIPRYTNALAAVALASSKWLESLIPIIDAIFRIGAFILEHLVAPLTEFALFVTSTLLNLPIISWLASLAGGLTVAAFGISRLSFGLISFSKLMSGEVILTVIRFTRLMAGLTSAFVTGKLGLASFTALFPRLGSALGSVLSTFQGIGSALSGGALTGGVATLFGSAATLGAVAVAYAAITAGMHNLADAEERITENNKDLIDQFERGNITLEQATAAAEEYGRAQGENLSVFGQVAISFRDLFTHPSRLFGTPADSAALDAQNGLIEELNRRLEAYVGNAEEAVQAQGALTDAQVKNLNFVRTAQGGAKEFAGFLETLTQAYNDGTINAGQYATILDQLGLSAEEAGSKVDLAALKVEGASNTIAQALLSIRNDAQGATEGLAQFAKSIGEDAGTFVRDTVEAFNDPIAGLLGTGQKVTEWFQDTKDAIRQWRVETADSLDFVSAALTNLSSTSDLTWESFKKGINDSVEAAQNFKDNLQTIIDLGASKRLLQWIHDQGMAAAPVLDLLAKKGKEGVDFVDKQLRKGATLGAETAQALGDALGITMDKILAAIEIMVSHLLDIPVGEVRKKVHDLVTGVNEETSRVKPIKPVDFSVSDLPAGRQFAPVRTRTPRGTTANTPSELRSTDQWAMLQPPEDIEQKWRMAGGSVVQGFYRGVTSSKYEPGKIFAKDTIQQAEDEFDMSSPSKVFIRIGKNVMLGFAKGVESATGAAVKSVTDAISMLTTGNLFQQLTDKWKGAKKGAEDFSTTIREDLVKAIDKLIDIIKNIPNRITISLSIDTTLARTRINSFLDDLADKGLKLIGSPQQQHSGGPAGTGSQSSGRRKPDEVDTRLQLGEYVVQKSAVSKGRNRRALDDINRGRIVFHDGGSIGADGIAEVTGGINTIVNSLKKSTVSGRLQKPDFAPQFASVGGLTAAASMIYGAVRAAFGSGFAMSEGPVVRKIRGTDTWSQHAYGNAVDIMVTGALHRKIAYWLDAARNALHIDHLLADPYFPSPLGDHTTHVHADPFPQYAGTPPGHPVGSYHKGGFVDKNTFANLRSGEAILNDRARSGLGDELISSLNSGSFFGSLPSAASVSLPSARGRIRTGGGSTSHGEGYPNLMAVTIEMDGTTIAQTYELHARENRLKVGGRSRAGLNSVGRRG